MTRERRLQIAAGVLLLLLVVSGVDPHERGTWLMEVAPVLIALPILWFTYRRFPLTPLLYVLLFLHGVILIVGGHYTYARVPVGFRVQEALDLSRNPYDKLGHFAQGFVPAILAREIFLRGGHVRRGAMSAFICICVSMAISAWYELIEWWAALALGEGAESFLGMQGDPWDTQSDMFLAFLGASLALAMLSRMHDRQMNRIAPADALPRDRDPRLV